VLKKASTKERRLILTSATDSDNIEYMKSNVYNKEGHLIHIYQNDSRFHVISYDAQGRHCSEGNCVSSIVS
jgi:YD repeat-containing protein